MFRPILRTTGVVACSTLFLSAGAFAHGVAGNRVFPTSLTIYDPEVPGQASPPAIPHQPPGASDNDVRFHQHDRSTKFKKKNTGNFRRSIKPHHTLIHQ